MLREYSVGETFVYRGVQLRVVISDDCETCYFNNKGNCDINDPNCFAGVRKDSNHVSYLKVAAVTKPVKRDMLLITINKDVHKWKELDTDINCKVCSLRTQCAATGNRCFAEILFMQPKGRFELK